jgi:hypothetical protein
MTTGSCLGAALAVEAMANATHTPKMLKWISQVLIEAIASL